MKCRVLKLRDNIDIPVQRPTYIVIGEQGRTDLSMDDYVCEHDEDSSTSTLSFNYRIGEGNYVGTCEVYSDYCGTWTEITMEGHMNLTLRMGEEEALAFINSLCTASIN
jgi:hypothetical protein